MRFALPACLAAVIAVLFAIEGPVRAGDNDKIDCTNAMNTYEQNYCADKDFQAADKKLNDAYNALLAAIAKSEYDKPYDAKSWEKVLRESQRAWVAFRDADCDGLVPMSWTGGTGTSVAVMGCKTAKTEARTKELLEYADGM